MSGAEEPAMNPRTVNPEFGEALRTLRKDIGLSILELTRRSGLSRSNLHRFESGEIATPTAESLNALARGLGVEPEVIYDLALGTESASVGLPSLPTYFRQKYDLDDEQIKAVERTLARVTKDDVTTNARKSSAAKKSAAKRRSASSEPRSG